MNSPKEFDNFYTSNARLASCSHYNLEEEINSRDYNALLGCSLRLCSLINISSYDCLAGV